MALQGIQIYKLLPQTNCKECGFPTCLAYAMKLAAKQVELSACPYVSEESKVGAGVPAAWGDWNGRAIAWETLTATALLESGADIIVLRHPESVRRVQAAIGELMQP